jgi:hypothetical protein
MAEVERELDILLERCSSQEQKEVVGAIRELAKKGQDTPHLYLRFRGD